MKISLNNKVKVKLNEYGFKIHKNRWKLLFSNYGHTYEPPKVDAEGYTEFHLHELINQYGPFLYNGCALPFESTELIIEETK